MSSIDKKIDAVLPKQRRVRQIILVFLDMLIAIIAGYLALYFRFDFGADPFGTVYFERFTKYIFLHSAVTVIIYFIFHLYRIMWSRASINEAVKIVELNLAIMLIELGMYFLLDIRMPRSFYPMSFIFQSALEFLLRYSYRLVKGFANTRRANSGPRTMIFGAGDAGHDLGAEMQNSNMTAGTLICYMDDNPNIKGKTLNGIPVLGNRNDIARVVRDEQIDQIFVAIPTAAAKDRAEITDICRNTGKRVKILPGTYQLINGEVSVSKLRPVQIEDLLGRDTVKVNMDEIAGYVKGKRVLVTGGGGSIGSELCRQIANHHPALLIILDIYENNAYDIQQELIKTHPELNLLVLIGSVRNTERVNQVMRDYRPDIVYHAAAHKHVPLMETSPKEAIKNNVFGTYKTAEAAERYGVKRFVLISTDKAVNPTNIMGASKRMCEMIIQMMNARHAGTEFVAVRFGNVLGSNGSVVPLFKKQIEAGGPVTVTDPNMVRYFMTIPEAVSLVLQAGAYAKGGEIFVLDMGQPVRILKLAENMIRLSGYKPYEEIPIEFTGLRPGEKLYEEMLMSEEGMQETPNHMIHIGKPIEMDYQLYEQQLKELYPLACSDEGDSDMKRKVAEIVTTYKPQFQNYRYVVKDSNTESVPTEGKFSVHTEL